VLEPRLLDAFVGRLGVSEVGSVEDLAGLAAAYSQSIWRGSLAKREALVAGVTPPGWDVSWVAKRELEARTAWTCHATASLFSGLVAGLGGESRLILNQRIDEKAAPVDVHSQVLVGVDGEEYLVDPHFGVGPMPVRVGESWNGVLREAAVIPGDGGASWIFLVKGPDVGDLAYRPFAIDPDPSLLKMFCDISVHSSGIPNRRYLTEYRQNSVLWMREGRDGAALEAWTQGELVPVREEFASWDEGLGNLGSMPAVSGKAR